jgi:hypothetical protein
VPSVPTSSGLRGCHRNRRSPPTNRTDASGGENGPPARRTPQVIARHESAKDEIGAEDHRVAYPSLQGDGPKPRPGPELVPSLPKLADERGRIARKVLGGLHKRERYDANPVARGVGHDCPAGAGRRHDYTCQRRSDDHADRVGKAVERVGLRKPWRRDDLGDQPGQRWKERGGAGTNESRKYDKAHRGGVAVRTQTPRPACATPRKTSELSIARRRPIRSATTPPTRMNTARGTVPAMSTMPNAVADGWLRRTANASATFAIPVPIDASWPRK